MVVEEAAQDLPPRLRGRASLDEKFATFNGLVNYGYRLRCPPPEKNDQKIEK